MTTREDQLDLITRVGRELKRLELWDHVKLARRLYANVRADREPGRDEWDYEMIEEWARLLRLPPFESAYPVRPWAWRCCEKPKTYTATVWPEGWKSVCETCRAAWLTLRP